MGEGRGSIELEFPVRRGMQIVVVGADSVDTVMVDEVVAAVVSGVVILTLVLQWWWSDGWENR